jgi:hypothetical protein
MAATVKKTVRQQFSVKLPFVPLFHQLFDGLSRKKCIAAFDASFIYKSGKKSYGLSRFWNGTAQRAEKGLEAGCLAIVDVKDGATGDPNNGPGNGGPVITGYQPLKPGDRWPVTVSSVILESNFIGWDSPGIPKTCMAYAKAQLA